VYRDLKLLRVLLSLLLLLPRSLSAQTQTAQVTPNGDGTFTVVMGGRTLLAVTDTVMKVFLRLRQDVVTLQAKQQVSDSTLAGYATYRSRAESLISADSAQIEVQKKQLADLRELVETQKKIIRKLNPLITVEAGAGGTTNGLAAIAGVGIRRLRIWGTLQEQGSGIFAGYQFSLW
jgi:hypothetical protein